MEIETSTALLGIAFMGSIAGVGIRMIAALGLAACVAVLIRCLVGGLLGSGLCYLALYGRNYEGMPLSMLAYGFLVAGVIGGVLIGTGKVRT